MAKKKPSQLSNATLKAFNSSLGISINVKHFGAKGDGVTDDAPAIQSAIDAASILSGIVFLPSGNYLIKNKINLPTGLKIYGTGYNSAIIADAIMDTLEAELGLTSMVEVTGLNHSTEMNNLRLVGNANYTKVFGWHGQAGSFNNKVQNCYFENFGCHSGGAVDPSNSYNNLITNNFFKDCYSSVFLTGTHSQYGNIVINNTIIGGVQGIRSEYAYNTVIANNNIKVSNLGIICTGTYNSLGNVRITGNFIEVTNAEVETFGIYLGAGTVDYGFSRNFIIDSNSIKIASNIGVGVCGIGTVENFNGYNILSNNLVTGGNQAQGVLLNNCHSWKIHNNIIRGSLSGTGIGIFNNSSYNIIKNNDIVAYYDINIHYGGQVSNVIEQNMLKGEFGISISNAVVLALNTIVRNNVLGAATAFVNEGNGTVLSGNIKTTGAAVP